MFNSNFDKVQVIGDDGIRVTGTSSAVADASLVMRRITLQQGATVAEGKADLVVPRWGSSPDLPADGFTDDDAVALGAEVYFLRSPTPGYFLFTWSQSVTLEKS